MSFGVALSLAFVTAAYRAVPALATLAGGAVRKRRLDRARAAS